MLVCACVHAVVTKQSFNVLMSGIISAGSEISKESRSSIHGSRSRFRIENPE